MSAPDSTSPATTPGADPAPPAAGGPPLPPPVPSLLPQGVERWPRLRAAARYARAVVLSERKLPAWLIVLLGVLTLAPEWKEKLAFWVGVTRDVGGGATAMFDAATSPVVPVVLLSVGGGLLVLTGAPGDKSAFGAWASRAGWLALFLLLVFFGSLLMFGYYVASSRIPETVRYVQEQRRERELTPAGRDRLYWGVRRIADRLPPFAVAAARDPEATQFAFMLMDTLYAAGVQLKNGDRREAVPATIDMASPSDRGVLIGVRDKDAPSQAARGLEGAFRQAGIDVRYMAIRGVDENYLVLVIGPK